MTMDQLYLPILLILVIAVIARIPTAIRVPTARPAWFATLIAVPAFMTRGPIIPIQTLDAWMGGENIIFLVQSWLVVFAFWGLAEAAGTDITSSERPKLRLWIPLLSCIAFTVPFFLIPNREGTELFFIDAHVDDLAAIICGVLYMAAVAGICVRLLIRLHGRDAPAHWVFRIGAALVIAGCVLWSTAIILDHALALGRTPIVWMYVGFDILFYPGVVALALGLVAFATQRAIRQLIIRRRVAALHDILASRSFTIDESDRPLPFVAYDLMVQIEDLRILGAIRPTAEEQRTLDKVARWVERTFPQVHDITTS